ncbi:hypothetical protein ABFX02_14G208900 [Erythranthe guttata]
MSRSIHFICESIPGYGTHDDKILPHIGVSGRAVNVSTNPSRGDYKLVSRVNFVYLRCGSSQASHVCHANPSHYRRNPDFTRQNKYGFSRNRNRHNEEINGDEDLQESEPLTSKNGPSFSFSGNRKYQATTTPGPREKEIVELFRKVQARLREKATVEEETKVDDSIGNNEESETVDSLLKLLRKHSAQQVKKNTNSAINSDFVLDRDPSSTEESSTTISDSNNSISKHETQESQSPILTRPKSIFRKRSPVPEIKFQPIYSEGSDNLVPHVTLAPEADGETEIESGVFDEILEDEKSETYESEHDNGEGVNLSGMKMIELRVIAKSCGVKGFSKLKKNELVKLLSRSSI